MQLSWFLRTSALLSLTGPLMFGRPDLGHSTPTLLDARSVCSVGKGESEEQQEPRAPPIIIASKDDYYDGELRSVMSVELLKTPVLAVIRLCLFSELYDNQDEDDCKCPDDICPICNGFDITGICNSQFGFHHPRCAFQWDRWTSTGASSATCCRRCASGWT